MNGTEPSSVRGDVPQAPRTPTEESRLKNQSQDVSADRYQVPGGWVVTSCATQADEGGVRWVSFTFFPESELDDASSSWPRDPSISSRTSRLRRN